MELDDFPISKKFRSKFVSTFILAIINNEEFTIKLEDVSKWIGTNECDLKRTLVYSYKPNTDYKIIKRHTKGRPKNDVFLTNDCFKRLCMRSRSKKAEEIRSYFILVEEMYREYMINGIARRILLEDEGISKNDHKYKTYPIGACVYVIEIINDSGEILYKVGRTRNLNRRFKEMVRSIPGELKIIYYELFEEHEFLEVCAHSFLKKYKVDGDMSEIFKADIDTITKWLKECKQFRSSRKKN